MSDQDSIFDGPLSPAARKQIANNLEKSNKTLLTSQDSLEADDLNSLAIKDKVLTSIDSSINKIFSRINASGSSDTSNEVLDNMISLANKRSQSNRASIKKKTQAAKELGNLQKEVVAANQQQLSGLLFAHKQRTIDAVATNNMIIKIIPKMRLALNTLANTILSPDDFTKQSLSVNVNASTYETNDVTQITKRANGLLETFDINKNIKNDILSYLVNGKLYYLVLPMKRQLATLLNENAKTDHTATGYRTLGGDTYGALTGNSLKEGVTIGEGEKYHIAELCEAFNIKEDDQKLETIGKNIDKFIAEEFIIGDGIALLRDNLAITENVESFGSFFGNNLVQNSASGGPIRSGAEVTEKDIKGREHAVVRRISPANIIPLDFEGANYGYIHLDIVEIDPDNNILPVDNSTDVEGMGMLPSSSGAMAQGAMLQNIIQSGSDIPLDGNNRSRQKNYENPNGSPGLSSVDDARLSFMAHAFANKLSKDANLKLLKRSDSLKAAIYNGLAIKRLSSNQKVRIVYLKPEEVVYINRGQSVFDNVLFFAKLYIATLITILLQNVIRGGDQRVVYVEVGQDNNGAHAVQQVIRDMKSKEISSIVNMDLQTVLNIHNQFQDYYIPVVDGEKPITFDTLDSLNNKSIDDEFLSWLSNNIFSGIGLPAAYLTEVENIDFAKSLSMQNSRFLRDCIAEQSILSRGFTELIRKVYDLEYNSNAESTGKKKKKKESEEDDGSPQSDHVDVSQLSVTLPAPAALSLMNIGEQMQNATTVVEQLVTSIDLSSIPEEQREAATTIIKGKIVRKYVTSFDWAEFDAMVNSAIVEYTEGKIEKDVAAADEDVTIDEEGLDDDTDTADVEEAV